MLPRDGLCLACATALTYCSRPCLQIYTFCKNQMGDMRGDACSVQLGACYAPQQRQKHGRGPTARCEAPAGVQYCWIQLEMLVLVQ